MDPQAQASFIPKKSLDVSTTHGGGAAGGLVFLVALLIFIASLVSAGSVYAYTQYLNQEIAQSSKSLTASEGAFEPNSIQDLVRLDSRLTQSKKLLASHVAVSGLFTFLSSQTLPNVSFKSFAYTLGDDGTAEIQLTGVANSFSTVALQSDQFGGNSLLKDVVFSNITVDPNGQVNFNVSATVDPSVISYTSTLNSTTVGGSETTPATSDTGVPADTSTTSASGSAFPTQ